jgi:DNA-binding GntR family transcriptional regulator
LKQAVLAGAFKPGEIVTLRGLAKRLTIGDTPVREAVKRLIAEGAFEALPNRSARVPLLDRREIQQILDLRLHA